MVDTSLLIDLFRKTDKSNSVLLKLVRQEYNYCISAVTEYEIHAGAFVNQKSFWDNLLKQVAVIPFDKRAATFAVQINSELKRNRQQIAIPDLFIAATATANNLPLATLNKKHFQRIDSLQLVPI